MEVSLAKLKNKSLVVVLTYAPAGLGHLRVTDALYEGLPEGVKPLLLGAQDKNITRLHRLTSIHPLLRRVMEWVQHGEPEDIFTYFYRRFLKNNTETIYHQLATIIQQRADIPKQVLVIATHFGLAHQLAAVKSQLEEETGVQIFLAVQVTDDSPQHIWLVPGADITFVPSDETKKDLENYAKTQKFKKPKIEVLPYPMNPKLTQILDKKDFKLKVSQLDINSRATIQMAIPISGAAVGLRYFEQLMGQLNKKTDKFKFYIISRQSGYTKKFLEKIQSYANCQLVTGRTDRQVVDAYERVYQKQVISLEVTKPSEQSFKSLIEPKANGGSILLFCQSVGRQEYDNLDFLARHFLIPNQKEQQLIWQKARTDQSLTKTEQINIFKQARHWRGIKLTAEPKFSAQLIYWCLKAGIFTHMLEAKVCGRKSDKNKNELYSDGVRQFWGRIVELL